MRVREVNLRRKKVTIYFLLFKFFFIAISSFLIRPFNWHLLQFKCYPIWAFLWLKMRRNKVSFFNGEFITIRCFSQVIEFPLKYYFNIILSLCYKTFPLPLITHSEVRSSRNSFIYWSPVTRDIFHQFWVCGSETKFHRWSHFS